MTVGSDTRLASLDDVLDGVAVDDGFAAELFAVIDVFESSVRLRRAVTDPATPPDGRAGLVHSLLDGKVAAAVIDLVADAARRRWGSGRTFTAALERQAVRAQLMAANEAGNLGETEDELFRFARTVESNPPLRNALADRRVEVDGRQHLVSELLANQATSATVTLAQRAVLARDRSFAHTIEGFVTLAADYQNRAVATVRVAVSMTPDQRQRLQAVLSSQVGRDVAIQEIVDPDVLGGIRVEVGDEVVEGTVAARLQAARRMFE